MTRCRSSGSPAVRVVSAVIARSRIVVPAPEYHRWAGSQVASVFANVMTPGLPRSSLVIPDTPHLPVPAQISHTAGRIIGATGPAREAFMSGSGSSARLGGRRELEPVKAVARQRQQVGELADRREHPAPHAPHRGGPPAPAPGQLDLP